VSQTERSGYLDVITPADPAAGANLTVAIPNQLYVVVRSLKVTVATDATAGNRFLSVDYLWGSRLTMMRNAAAVLLTANTAATVFQFDGQHTVSDFATGTMVFAPLKPLPLPNGVTVQVTLDNKQGGDTLTSCIVVVDRYWKEHRDYGGSGLGA
jgi:hypothetical protein